MRVVLLQQLSFAHLIGTCEKCLETRPPACLGGLAMIANSSTSLQHTQTRAKTDQGKKRGETMAIGRGSGAFCGKADTVGEPPRAEICVSHIPSWKPKKLGKLPYEKVLLEL